MYSLALVACVVAVSHCALAGKVCPRPPEVLFATIDVNKNVYEVGEEIEYTCRPGFVPNNGQRKYTCLPTGKWPLNTLLCLPKRCPSPGPLQHGKMDFLDLRYQSSISFSCDPGYNLVGTRTSQCMADGKWSGTFPQCEPVTCAPPSLPEFGVLSYRRLKPGNISHFLDTIIFECVPPLALIGNETATCMANGNWSSIPECKGPCKIPVKKAVVLYNGEKKRVQNDLKEGIQHGETISFFCKNKEKSCAYTVAVPCVDGNLTLPACFKERGFFSSLVKKDPSDMKPCEDQE
ncbi:beta-2-glycoprotein 1 isoform X2 [Falco rusticolus]|uniref:beta-2-glycoprotein 1 isoform X2 n=1 Tax=Falco rusticolus TaxID=120794 RepID=UPI000FFBA566|nr:beta-2-glycoprotein 1 isoform X2 [Falco rusticolus]